MLIDWSTKIIQSKVVYYGPAMSGKTTSIKTLFQKLGQGEKIESIETTSGRTLFFDFGAINLERGDWTLQVYIWSATGQDYYAETRSTVLSGTDGIIFVADIQPHLLDDNIRSWRELNEMFRDQLHQTIPVVITMNKYDLPNAITQEKLVQALALKNGVQIFTTIATQGRNITESFAAILKSILTK
ncbi:MAG: ATP/GTP-binding protein [Promethearchaeota archaeon]